ncbi:MAG TPA: sterol desaturase family protein [Polyangia bacterium]|jgi:Sterol desaturase|nr:sterol desaturase family protein [Polyangia bacterium]
MQLFEWEPPELRARWEAWIRAGYALFAVGFAVTVVVDAFAHETVTLGPGLVDEAGGVLARFQSQLTGASPGFLAVILLFSAFVLAWNGIMLYRGFSLAQALPRRQIVSFVLLNTVLVFMLYLCLILAGAVSAALGHGFLFGFALIRHYTLWCSALITRVPTLVHLPYPLPLLASIALVDLFHYWFHRLGHTWRPFWLLWHRPHHMPPFLTIPTTQPVFAAFPLFLLLSVPFQLGLGVCAKLFYSDAMIAEALLLRMLGQIVLIGSHNTALYATFWRSRPLRALSAFFGEGPYHYMHHSTLPGHSLVNLGGPLFMLWDRVFGTYVAPSETRPPIGLQGSPRLHLNPLRLALAGLLQLGYELRHNRGIVARLRVLFGSSNFAPADTRDYVLP